jgi:diguanylate cyclase (GGDEF)-like protein/PAS domain S-box-containing protein
VEKIDVSLQSTERELELARRGSPANPAALKRFIAAQESFLPEIDGLRVADAAGVVSLGRDIPVHPFPNIADREYFIHCREINDGKLYMSQPYFGRVNKKWSVAFVRRYNHPDHRFAGVVFATYSLDQLQRLANQLDLGPHGVISIRNTSLASLARVPLTSNGQMLGIGDRRVSKINQELTHSGMAFASYRAVTPFDHYERSFTFHRLNTVPLIVIVGFARVDYLAGWQREADWTVGFCISFLLLSLLGSLLLLHSLGRVKQEGDKNRLMLDRSSDGIHIIDQQGYLIEASDSFCLGLRYSREEMLGMHVSRWDAELTPEQLRARIGGQDLPVTFKTVHRRKDGSLIDVEINSVRFFMDGQRYLYASSRDISERKLADEKLHLAASVFSHASEGIMITEADGTIIDVNQGFTDLTGYSRDEVLGKTPQILSSGRQDAEFYRKMWADLNQQGDWHGEVWNRRKNGEIYAEMLTISTVRDEQGKALHYVALFADITRNKEQEKQLQHIAHYDALTGLPNRVLLADRMHQAMAQVLRRGEMLALVYLDLDGFKAVNDTHGHSAGDRLLGVIAGRMKEALRDGDTLARLGGDEFVAVLPDLADLSASVPVLTRMLNAAAEPVYIDNLMLQVSASIGVTFYPQASEVDADQLLRQGDQAMYQAKLSGKNRYHIFDDEHDRRLRSHHESLEDIRRALAGREFVLYYQPKVNMRSGKVIGAEALIRWRHPDKGLLLPGLFLPVIEDHLLAIEIGEWVIDSALAQMVAWRAEGLRLPVSVNVGALQLQQANFVERLQAQLAAHPGIGAGDLQLEVLETSALKDLAQAAEVIDVCREIGISFALDDFGTGYSSLSYLKQLAVGHLKIDQSFVRDMLEDPDDLAILEGVLGLATAFRRQVIAEGVETIEQGVMLLQLGCELAQGFCIARPMPAEAFAAWAADWRPDPQWRRCTPVSREDLPLLFACTEHRAWIAGIEKYLAGELKPPLPMDPHRCRFGCWLDEEGVARYGAHSALKTILQLHDEVRAQALARVGELHVLRAALIAASTELLAADSSDMPV